MKKLLAMVMVICLMFSGTLGLCFGEETEAASADVRVMATVASGFEITECINIQGIIDDQALSISDLWVTNRTADRTITVENVQATGSGDWTLTTMDDVNAAAKDTKYIYLAMEDQSLQIGCIPTNGEITGDGVSKNFAIEGLIPKQTSGMDSTEVAKIVVTLSISGLKEPESNSTGTVNSYTIDYLKTVSWASGTNAEIVAVIKAVDEGKIDPLDLDGWKVGDVRNISLSGLNANFDFTDNTGYNYAGTASSYSAETVPLVIMDIAGSTACQTKKWIDENGKTRTASFIVGIETYLGKGVMVSSADASTIHGQSWRACGIRAWLNSTFYDEMLNTFGVTEDDNFFKLVTNVTGAYNATNPRAGGANTTTYDYFALPAEREVVGKLWYSTANEYENGGLAQFTWYKTEANQPIGVPSNYNYDRYRWFRSVSYKGEGYFACAYTSSSSGNTYGAAYTGDSGSYGYIAPFGCL